MAPTAFHHEPGFHSDFVRRLQAGCRIDGGTDQDFPRFDVNDASELSLLVAPRSQPVAFSLGTGASIYSSVLIPAILSAQSEIILVTCFWAPSKTLTALSAALSSLAQRRRDLIQRDRKKLPPLRVRICLSSTSFLQKLLHTPSRDGYIYPPSTWSAKLGLPDEATLAAGGIDLVAKSLFFLPFSVMHPKFVIVDRQRAFFPSCNVSWEPWLEGCLEVGSAPGGQSAITSLLTFYARTWDEDLEFQDELADAAPIPPEDRNDSTYGGEGSTIKPITSTAHSIIDLGDLGPLPTCILPSSHHRNPRFRFLPWQSVADAPSTPLNAATLELFNRAYNNIFIQTPDVTSEPVISALLSALQRGTDVTIVTNSNIKIWEQIVTAGTTTVRCVNDLAQRYQALKSARNQNHFTDDVEAQQVEFGRLRISYFHSRPGAALDPEDDVEEPVQSHLKLTIVDDEFTLLGSGNMDRASWYTSQELGVLFSSRALASRARDAVSHVLDGRIDAVFDSGV